MTYKSALCPAQEALHRDRAAVANVHNVRIAVTSAATGWAREAVVAFRCEDKLSREDRLPAAASLSEKAEEGAFSENPGRGLAI